MPDYVLAILTVTIFLGASRGDLPFNDFLTLDHGKVLGQVTCPHRPSLRLASLA